MNNCLQNQDSLVKPLMLKPGLTEDALAEFGFTVTEAAKRLDVPEMSLACVLGYKEASDSETRELLHLWLNGNADESQIDRLKYGIHWHEANAFKSLADWSGLSAAESFDAVIAAALALNIDPAKDWMKDDFHGWGESFNGNYLHLLMTGRVGLIKGHLAKLGRPVISLAELSELGIKHNWVMPAELRAMAGKTEIEPQSAASQEAKTVPQVTSTTEIESPPVAQLEQKTAPQVTSTIHTKNIKKWRDDLTPVIKEEYRRSNGDIQVGWGFLRERALRQDPPVFSGLVDEKGIYWTNSSNEVVVLTKEHAAKRFNRLREKEQKALQV